MERSTLSRLILGLESSSSGQILLDGKAISVKGQKAKRNSQSDPACFTGWKSALDPHFTVYQAIAEPIRNLLHVPKRERTGENF